MQCTSVDNREDLDGLAALIEVCDLVVSTSNVTIHMAGALAKETWVMLPRVAVNFWWLVERTDSIWYPSLTLYRQQNWMIGIVFMSLLEMIFRINYTNFKYRRRRKIIVYFYNLIVKKMLDNEQLFYIWLSFHEPFSRNFKNYIRESGLTTKTNACKSWKNWREC